MKSFEIRQKFLNFFKSKGHTIIASDSLVPKEDPTVLFTTAGMQQFKRQFLGQIDDYTKATTSQKCMRTDDLEEVGVTDFHHTFFEMLGNFSFGDYFKKEAIEWAWEFFTKELNIPKEKLWVSVYKDDSEAESIWLNNIGIPKEKIVRLGDKSNFWPANAKQNGPNGPCGPCSEIFYDWGTNHNCKSKVCDPSCDCGRFCEVWNLVFTQFNRKDGGILEPLPSKNIDTGMGLERLTAVMQGKKNNYETDIFEPILKAIEKEVSANLPLKQKRIIADHIRGITFGISDGVIPSNEGRGYVIKKLIIICSEISQANGMNKPCIYKLVNSLTTIMGEIYPDIIKNEKNISQIIKNIEQAYIKVRTERIPELTDKITELIKKHKALSGNVYDSTNFAQEIGSLMFEFKDTYGLPYDTVVNVLEKKCRLFDEENEDAVETYKKFKIAADKTYNQLMQEQQERSRASSKMTGDVFTDSAIDFNVPKTNFLGYNHIETTSTILKLIVNDNSETAAKTSDKVKIILDRTPFYAESGGQIGDTGKLVNTADSNSIINIISTQKVGDIFLHIGEVVSGKFNINDQVRAIINCERRLSIMRNHTTTHLLQSSLRTVLGDHVQQQGSLVNDERLRFDFTHTKALTNDEIFKIESIVNKHILDCDTVIKENLSIEEAKQSGALAFFAEKYGDTVRVVSINDYSKELCGGTHLDSTGQIGFFKIISECAIAQGIRRIEAKTGLGAFEYSANQEKQLLKLSQLLKAPEQELVTKVENQIKKIKELEKQIEELTIESLKSTISNIVDNCDKVKDISIVNYFMKNTSPDVLKKALDIVKSKLKSYVVVLAAANQEAGSIIVAVSDDLVKNNIKATEIINKISSLVDGKGGGRPNMAQAGTKEINKIEPAIKKANEIVKGFLNNENS